MTHKPILCVDFDGVVHSYTSGWKGEAVIPDPPVPGALRWLWHATRHWDVHIYSSRSRIPEGVGAMQAWFREHAARLFNEDTVDMFMRELKYPTRKPGAFLTIDYRAICFDGHWADLDPEKLLSCFRTSGNADRKVGVSP